jgi:CDP-6-deoxy-D-xylo-4-hexulose-3-dehydrase
MGETITLGDRLKLARFVLTTKKFTSGEKLKQFESQWSQWLGCKHSLYVSSGSTANFLLVAAIIEMYKLRPGDKVLVPACTWVTNVGPIIQLGLIPIFCDVNIKNFSFDLDEAKKIAKKHKDIKMIFVTHLLGFSGQNNELKKMFPEALIIDDVCESHGCTDSNGIKKGADSLGATFSFYFGHHMSTVEGGMISTNNTELYDLMKMKRSHGLARESINFVDYAAKYSEIDKQFLFITDGYNFRNHEFGAVLGISQLNRLDNMISIRKRNYKRFTEILSKYPELFYQMGYDETNSSFCLPFICKNKSIMIKMKEIFSRFGIEYRPVVSGNLLRQPFLKNYSLDSDKKISTADIINDQGVYIGNNHFITDKDMDFLESILENINE